MAQFAGGGANTACTYAGLATAVSLSGPAGLAVDASGNVYIVDRGRNCVRKVTGTNIARFAGGGANTACTYAGLATAVSLNAPSGIAIDSTGRVVIVDGARNCVRLVTGANIGPMAGTGTAGLTGDNGPAIAARLSTPGLVAANASGDVWIADTLSNRIRRVEGPL